MRLLDEYRFALRTLRKVPTFTVSAVLVLAIAIAANTAVFSAVDAVLLRRLPITDPDRLVLIWESNPGRNQSVKEVSYRNFADWREQLRTFDDMAAFGSVTWSTVLDDDRPDVTRLARAGVSGTFFTVLGIEPLLGRAVRPGDDMRGAPGVVVLAHAVWQQRFGGDPGIVGSALRLGGRAYTVVGVMPRGFSYPQGTEVWTALVPELETWNDEWRVDTLQSRSFGVLYVIGRLAPSATLGEAAAEMDAVVRRMPEFRSLGTPVVVLTPILDHVFGQTRVALFLLLGMVALVLAIACANVAGLLLTRSVSRRRDIAVKVALGAERWRLLREWFAETSIMTAIAAAAGIALAYATLPLLIALAPADIPQIGDATINARVAAFSVGLSLLTAVLCALVVATDSSGHSLGEMLKAVRLGEGRTSRTRRVLIALQLTIATVLLVGASLLVRSFVNLRQLDIGFEAARVLTLHVEPLADNHAQYRAVYKTILERVRALPGVQGAGAVYLRPLVHAGIGLDSGLLLEGQRIENPESFRNNPSLNFQAVTPGYFEAMRIGLRAGRLLSNRDDKNAPGVAVVSESTARRLWPGEDPIGKRLSIAAGVTEDGRFPWQTVVGVVSDVRYRGLTDVRFDVYMSAAQTQHRVKHLMVRTAAEPLSVVEAVQAAVRAAAGRVIVENVTTMDTVVDNAVAPWRFSMTMFVTLAAVAAGLAAVGLFGLVAYSVAQRTPELAVRIAVGATASHILRMILWDGARVAITGLALGAVASLLMVNALSSLLFRVEPRDARAFIGAVMLLGVITLLAASVAARRVTRIDPVVALRGDQ
jgi:putative ABC transport system permease protein